MRDWRPWLCLLAASGTLLLLGGTCVTDVRDALYGGALDFVSGTTADTLADFLKQLLAA